MCGIFGVYVSRDSSYSSDFVKRSIRTLARESQSRGKDSSGLVLVDDRSRTYHVLKGAIPLNSLLRAPDVSNALLQSIKRYANASNGTSAAFTAIGHSRLVTNGSQLDDENNQPVIKSGIIGVHNGILVNDAAVWERHPHLCRDYAIDTEVFLAMMRSHLDSGYDIPAALSKSEQEIEGTISTAMLIPDRQSIVLYTNNGSLYMLTNDADILCFASEYYPLRVLADRMNLDPEKHRIQQIESGTGVILENEKFPLSFFSSAAHRDSVAQPIVDQTASDYEIVVSSVGNGKPQLELITDVALIAKAPEAARLESL